MHGLGSQRSKICIVQHAIFQTPTTTALVGSDHGSSWTPCRWFRPTKRSTRWFHHVSSNVLDLLISVADAGGANGPHVRGIEHSVERVPTTTSATYSQSQSEKPSNIFGGNSRANGARLPKQHQTISNPQAFMDSKNSGPQEFAGLSVCLQQEQTTHV